VEGTRAKENMTMETKQIINMMSPREQSRRTSEENQYRQDSEL
jgi:hypothetical protein